MKLLFNVPPLVLLVIATTLEVCGDAIIRLALYEHAGVARIALLGAGAACLLGYGTLLNLSPIEFGKIVGLYIATLFVVWQFINFIVFRSVPTLPVWVGGSLIIGGGIIVTYWKPTL